MHIIVTGNIGSVSEIRTTPNGSKVLDFSVAENERYTNSAGETVERTDWYRVSLWNEHAVSLAPFLTKGRLVEVSATRLRSNPYTDKDGVLQSNIQLGDVKVKLLGSNPSNQRPAVTAEDIDKLLAEKLAAMGITNPKPPTNQRKAGKKSAQHEEAPRQDIPEPAENAQDIPF